jgi:hypothetical protein
MSQCPTTVQLEQLLAEQLRGAEHETVEAHVETCASCQERLELLVGSTIDAASPRGSRRSAGPGHEPGDDFLHRLRLTPPPQPVPPAAPTPVPQATAQAPGPREEPRTPAASDRPGLGQLGQYELLEKLGRGGMGTVYKARHCELGKVVALKVLPAELMNEVTIARFRNEMRAVGKLEHPNIVGAHDGGQLDGTHFLVMEFIDGSDLARLVHRHGSLRLPDACELTRQAAVGLQHAYEHGLVHRDIKPSNLMLARNGLAKVLDLGLARSLGDAPSVDRLTGTGQILGTADYIAPEQCEAAHTADIRADIYSLGCTLYHLLAGTPPFGGAAYSSWLQKMKAHLDTPVPPIRQWRPEVPAKLVGVLDRMLAKNPADRFATPAEVAAAVQPFAAGSDLARLVQPGAGPTQQAQLAPQPGPGPAPAQPIPAFQKARRPSAGRKPFPKLVTRRSLRLAALAGCGVLIAAALVLWPRFGKLPPAPGDGLPQGASMDTPEKTLGILAMHVRHFRGEEAKPLGEIGVTSQKVQLDDDVRVEVNLSVPAYCYLIAFNPDGADQLCHPEDTEHAERAKTKPPAQIVNLHYPQKEGRYFGLDAAGLQAFVLVASTQPLPPYEQWRSQIAPFPWRPPAKATGVWQFDGQEIVRLPRERGTERERGVAPRAFEDLCKFFRNRSEFEAVRAFAFPVTND